MNENLLSSMLITTLLNTLNKINFDFLILKVYFFKNGPEKFFFVKYSENCLFLKYENTLLTFSLKKTFEIATFRRIVPL